MKHEHTPAEAMRAHFESRSIVRKRIRTRGPEASGRSNHRRTSEDAPLLVLSIFGVVPLSVVEDDVEHPIGYRKVRGRNMGGAEAGRSDVEQQRPPVAVANALEIA